MTGPTGIGCVGIVLLSVCQFGLTDVYAENTVMVPMVLIAQESEDQAVDVAVMSWDHGRTPDPLQMRWKTSQIPVRGTAIEPLMKAFDYAMAFQQTTAHPTGILTLSLTLSIPLGNEGASVGAGLAVGFLAVLRGDQLVREMAITGTLESSGRIGWVMDLEKKIKIAVRQGYRVVLVPRGQLGVPRTRLVGMEGEPSLIIREVGTVEEAYAIMTGK